MEVVDSGRFGPAIGTWSPVTYSPLTIRDNRFSLRVKSRTPMTVAILADDVLKQELLASKLPVEITVVWVDSLRALTIAEADVYIDLLFEMDAERTQHLKRLLPKPVMVKIGRAHV